MVTPYSHVSKNNHRAFKNEQKNRINFLLMALPIIFVCMVVIVFANGGDVFSKSIRVLPIINYQYYDYCLAQSNGAVITISCPTTYGTAYKVVTSIPKELALQLEAKIFSIRGISALVAHDTVILEYQKKMYPAALVH
jgi:hypothetical protein